MIARTRRGYDAGKINGTKRHLAVDTLGLLLTVLVTAASVQDRDAAKPLLWNLRRPSPTVKLTWAGHHEPYIVGKTLRPGRRS